MVYMFLANGVEEIEAITIIDVLRRFGIDIKTISVDGMLVRGAHGINFEADCLIDDAIDYAMCKMFIFPGGLKSVQTMLANNKIFEILECHTDVLLAAICAAPLILHKAGVLKGFTCHPSVIDEIGLSSYSDSNIVQSGRVITAKSVGYSLEFSIKLCEVLSQNNGVEALKEVIYCAK